jgi:hypothetical protein
LEKEIFPAKPDNPPPYEQLGFLPDDEDVPERVPFPVEAEELAEPDEIMKHDSVIAKLPLLPPVRTPQINADGTTAAVGRRKTAVGLNFLLKRLQFGCLSLFFSLFSDRDLETWDWEYRGQSQAFR